MFEKALSGSKKYWALVFFLMAVSAVEFTAYLKQYFQGLGVTGMGRDFSWGIYIAQFTFLVGVAASAVMVVLPYYLHNYKVFGKIVVLGEFLAVSAVLMCMLFIMADMGKPERFMNIMLHPTPNSVMFWDFLVLAVYLMLNLLCGWTALSAEKKELPPPKWIKPFIYLSIPWAVSIHTVTAFLYAGLPGRHFWMTAIMAPRFLSSAFSSGPALLILLALIVRRYTKFDAGREAIGKLAMIVTYAAIINLFFLLMELFTSFYSGIPGHQHTFTYLFAGLEGKGNLIPWMWTSAIFNVVAIFMLLAPATRRSYGRLAVACVILFTALWIDKGVGLVIGGFVPNPLEHVFDYHPTMIEIMVTLGVWAIGFLMLTVLYKIAVAIKEEKAV
jgi:molybdopterin-containing oxidoreductase family membrane subunit